MSAFLDVDSGDGIRGAEAPPIVAVGSFETENARTGVGIGRAEAAGLNFSGARGIDVEACRQRAVDRIADFKAIEEILRLAGTCTGDVEIIATVPHHFWQNPTAFGHKG